MPRCSRDCRSILGISFKAMGYGCWSFGAVVLSSQYFCLKWNSGIRGSVNAYFNHSFFTIFFSFKQIVEEAGGAVTCMDGRRFCVFDRSVLVSNSVMHAKVRPHRFFVDKKS